MRSRERHADRTRSLPDFVQRGKVSARDARLVGEPQEVSPAAARILRDDAARAGELDREVMRRARARAPWPTPRPGSRARPSARRAIGVDRRGGDRLRLRGAAPAGGGGGGIAGHAEVAQRLARDRREHRAGDRAAVVSRRRSDRRSSRRSRAAGDRSARARRTTTGSDRREYCLVAGSYLCAVPVLPPHLKPGDVDVLARCRRSLAALSNTRREHRAHLRRRSSLDDHAARLGRRRGTARVPSASIDLRRRCAARGRCRGCRSPRAPRRSAAA